MLLHDLIHPEILAILGQAGHSSRVLIADGNYPSSHTLGPSGALVSLNLSPGVVSCTDVLKALVTTIPIEKANVMDYARTGPYGLSEDPPIWTEFRRIFADNRSDLELETIERFEFYDTVQAPNHVLTIQTADQRIYANLLLTVGVRMPE